jgi:hypothetical protein
MEEKNKKPFGQDEPLNEGRPDFKPPDAAEMEGDVPPEKEASLLNMRTLIIAVGGLIGMIVFVNILAGVLFGYFSFLNPFGVAPPPAAPGSAPPVTFVPPAPTLQVDYISDLQQVLATQEANINDYGWINQEQGIARIPIERAMELVAQQGLPVTTAAPQPSDGPPPGEADVPDNSGFGFATPTP